ASSPAPPMTPAPASAASAPAPSPRRPGASSSLGPLGRRDQAGAAADYTPRRRAQRAPSVGLRRGAARDLVHDVQASHRPRAQRLAGHRREVPDLAGVRQLLPR